MVKYIPFSVAMLLLALLSGQALSAELKNGVTHLNQDEFVTKAQEDNTVIIDVRTPREYSGGHIAGAVNIPHAEILDNIGLLQEYKGKDLVFYCHSGVRVRWVTNYLTKAQFGDETGMFHLKGDMRAWRARGKPVEK